MEIEDGTTWPTDVLSYLEQHDAVFRGWEQQRSGGASSVSGQEYDAAVRGLRHVLNPYTLHGYHCTRLTDFETARIVAEGMTLPDGDMLRFRINALLEQGLVTDGVAARLIQTHQADETKRKGRIWICFFRPGLAGESGIGDLVGLWGGEALYNSHDRDPDMGPVLRTIGTPCIVEADVPIGSLVVNSLLDDKIARQYLKSRGMVTTEPTLHEDRAIKPIPASNIRRVIRFPEADFVALTGCDEWAGSQWRK